MAVSLGGSRGASGPVGHQAAPCDGPARLGTFILLRAETRSLNNRDSSTGRSARGRAPWLLAGVWGAGDMDVEGDIALLPTARPGTGAGTGAGTGTAWLELGQGWGVRAAPGPGRPVPSDSPTPSRALTPTPATPLTRSFLVTQKAGKNLSQRVCFCIWVLHFGLWATWKGAEQQLPRESLEKAAALHPAGQAVSKHKSSGCFMSEEDAGGDPSRGGFWPDPGGG